MAAAAAITWESLSDVSEPGKAVLKEAGLSVAVAKKLVDELGYSLPEDLQVCIGPGMFDDNNNNNNNK